MVATEIYSVPFQVDQPSNKSSDKSVLLEHRSKKARCTCTLMSDLDCTYKARRRDLVRVQWYWWCLIGKKVIGGASRELRPPPTPQVPSQYR